MVLALFGETEAQDDERGGGTRVRKEGEQCKTMHYCVGDVLT